MGSLLGLFSCGQINYDWSTLYVSVVIYVLLIPGHPRNGHRCIRPPQLAIHIISSPVHCSVFALNHSSIAEEDEEAEGALLVVLAEGKRRVGRAQAAGKGDLARGAGRDLAGAGVDDVAVAGQELAVGEVAQLLGLVVVGGVAGDGAGADGVGLEQEVSGALEAVARGVAGREVKDQAAVLANGLLGRQLQVEDGAPVVGGHGGPGRGLEGPVGLAGREGQEEGGLDVVVAEQAVLLNGVGGAVELRGRSAGAAELLNARGGEGGQGKGQKGDELHFCCWVGGEPS